MSSWYGFCSCCYSSCERGKILCDSCEDLYQNSQMQREVTEMAYNTYKELIYHKRSFCLTCGENTYIGSGRGTCDSCLTYIAGETSGHPNPSTDFSHSGISIKVGDATLTLEDLKMLEKSLSWQEAMNKELSDKVEDLKNAIIEFKEFAEEQSRNSRRPASVNQPWKEVVEHCLATLEKNE